MTLYLDASLVVAIFTPEDHSGRAEAWWATQDADTLAISDWVTTEVAAAFSGKVRARELAEPIRCETWNAFLEWEGGDVRRLPFRPATFRLAARLAGEVPDLGLRGGDALHLAVAVEHNATLCTLDQRFARAAEGLGHRVTLV